MLNLIRVIVLIACAYAGSAVGAMQSGTPHPSWGTEP